MILISILFLCLLLFCPTIALAGSRYGATLWLTQLLPTLLPFFIAIRLLDSCLPNVTGRRAFLLTGILCGYPAGASLVMSQYDRKLLTRRQAYFYLGFVNNPSPMFILVFCGTTVLGLSFQESLCLFGILLLSSLLGSILFLGVTSLPVHSGSRCHSRRNTAMSPGMEQRGTSRRSKARHIHPGMEQRGTSRRSKARRIHPGMEQRGTSRPTSHMAASCDATGSDHPPAHSTDTDSLSSRLDHIIIDSFVVLVKIGGYVIIFSIFGQFMNHLASGTSALSILCSGILEITSGSSYLQAAALPLHTKKILIMAILSFGGLSAAAQTNSILAKSELSILPYLIIKAGNGMLAALTTFLLSPTHIL